MKTVKSHGLMTYVPTTDVDKEMLQHMVEKICIEIIQSNKNFDIQIGKNWEEYISKPNYKGEIFCKFDFQGEDGNYINEEIVAIVSGYYPTVHFSRWPFSDLGIEKPDSFELAKF